MKMYKILSLIVLTHSFIQASFHVAGGSLPSYQESFSQFPSSYFDKDQVLLIIKDMIYKDCFQRLQMLKTSNPNVVTYQSWSVGDYIETLRTHHTYGKLILPDSVHTDIAVRLCNFKTYNQISGNVGTLWNNIANELTIAESSKIAVSERIKSCESLLGR